MVFMVSRTLNPRKYHDEELEIWSGAGLQQGQDWNLSIVNQKGAHVTAGD